MQLQFFATTMVLAATCASLASAAQLSARLEGGDDSVTYLAEGGPDNRYGSVSSDGTKKDGGNDRFSSVSSSSNPSTGGFTPHTAPSGTTAVKNMFMEMGSLVEKAYGKDGTMHSLHQAAGYVDNAEDNALKGAKMVLNGDREFSMDDAATLTASIPYVGDAVNILGKSLAIGKRIWNFRNSDACYRLYWKPQYKRPATTKKVKGIKDELLLQHEVISDPDWDGLGDAYNVLDVDWKRCDTGREPVFGFCAEKCDDIRKDFISCGLFCSTQDYCDALKDTLLANIIGLALVFI